ncbi:MAG TPA: VCBS repeat-containing protein [Bacteroidales bacterium]|nr:VCBS repeat-containing protein [Bacteroidales bacterium]
MIKKILLLISLLPLLARPQQFTDIRAGLVGTAHSAAIWIDHDRDGDLDIIVSGQTANEASGIKTQHYRNLRNDRFEAFGPGLPDFFRGDIAKADVDLDGIEDLCITGELRNGRSFTAIYRGRPDGSYSLLSNNFVPLRNSSAAFADADGDGDPDLLLTGESSNGPVTLIYRNDRNGQFTGIDHGIRGVMGGAGKWVDFNIDGLPDIMITGTGANGSPVSMLFRNMGQMRFSAVNTAFVGLSQSNIAIGDYDNDGDPDILLIGLDGAGQGRTLLYNNTNRQGSFSMASVNVVPVWDGFADWGDFDLDGDLDLLISGRSHQGAVSKVYRNDRNNRFVEINAGIIPLYNSSGQWGDYDLDGDLDILIAGLSGNGQPVARVYKNNAIEIKQTARVARREVSTPAFTDPGPPPSRLNRDYFYVFSSAYADVHRTGQKGYYLFMGPVKKFPAHYVLEEKFNEVIMSNYPTWGKIDQGNIIQNGFPTKSEADKSRARMMHEYRTKGFNVVEINW